MHNLGTGPAELACFAVDLWNDRIFLNDKSYLTGQLSTAALNWDNDLCTDALTLAGRLYHSWIEIKEEKLNKRNFVEAKENLVALHAMLFSNEPFSLLDMETEQKAVELLFSDESYWDMGKEDVLFEAFLSYLQFYYYIPSDVVNFRQAFINLDYQYLNRLKVRNEHGFALACQKFFMNIDNIDMLEDTKPVPQFEGFNPSPNALSMLVVTEHPERDDKLVFVNRMYFDDWMSFLVSDFLYGLHHGHSPKRCLVCGRHFLMADGRHQKYCDGFAPKDEKGRTCRQVAAATGRDEKERAEDHPVKVICACRLNTIAKHLRSGKITEELAAASKRLACERRDRALFEHDYAVGQYESDMSQDAIYSAAKQELSINS